MITEQQLLDTAEEMRIHLEEWQKEIIFDRTSKRFCLNCGRKRGKTTAIEFRTAMRLLNDDIKGNGLIGGIAIVSEELKAAKQILAGIKTILSAFGWRFYVEEKYLSEEKKIAYATTQEIRMPNGNRVMVFPAGHAGDNIRPYTFHEFIYDEADFINDEVYVATNPCLARFDGVEILESTPNRLGSKETYFARAFFGARPDYKIYHLPSTESTHISKEWLSHYKQTHSKLEYEREILAQFVSDITAVFPTQVVESCLTEEWPPTPEAIFFGIKPGRFDEDNTYIAENHYREGISWLRLHILPHEGRRIAEIESEMLKIGSNANRIVVDTTSLGSTPIESLAIMLGENVVIGVKNHETIKEIEGVRSRYMKEDLYVGALKLMERSNVRFMDRRIQAALIDVKYQYSRRNKTLWIMGTDIADAVVRALFPIWGRQEWLGPIPSKFMFFKQK